MATYFMQDKDIPGQAPLHIMLFIDSLVAGGAQRQVVETALQLTRLRHRVFVVIYHDIRELGAELVEAGIEVVLVKKATVFDPRFLWRLYQLMRERRPQVLQSYLFTPNLWARLVGRAARIRVVVTSERNVDLARAPLRVWLERLVYRLGDGVIVNAEAIRKVLTVAAGVPDSRIHTIYNAVDAQRFAPPPTEQVTLLRTALGLTAMDFVITLPGRVIPQKNHACLLRAVARLEGGMRGRVRVLFVGNILDEGYKASVANAAKDAGIERQVIFAGCQPDMAAVYALSDVVVLPSLWEGFPNVVLEAMSAGRPVVASAIADNDHLIRDGETGYLFSSDEDAELASVLLGLMNMPPEGRAALGEAARASVSQRFTPSMLVEANLAIYQSMLLRGEAR